MALLDLPVELMLEIFSHLGFGFFQHDLARLTVCKQWHRVAETSMLRAPRLGSPQLLALAAKDADSEALLAGTSSLCLALQGFSVPLCQRGTVDVPKAAWAATVRLNAALETLGTALLPRCRALRHLRVHAELPELLMDQPHGFLSARALDRLLAGCRGRHLTSLEFDISDCHASPRMETTETNKTTKTTNAPLTENNTPAIHLCRSLRQLLPSLRRLRCRLDHMCESLLAPPPDGQQLDVEEVLLMLVLEKTRTPCSLSPARAAKAAQMGMLPTSYRLGKKCCSSADGQAAAAAVAALSPHALHGLHGLHGLQGHDNTSRPDTMSAFLAYKQAMEDEATAFSRHLRRPRMVRVLWHESPVRRLTAWDAVAQKHVRLLPGQDWDAPGQVIDPGDDGSDF